MRFCNRAAIYAAMAAVIANSLVPSSLLAGDWRFGGREPTTVEQLASEIDDLEEHIDTYGTVVAKAPDVWGQARLTKYRVEYETTLAAELKEFKVRLNGAISRSDQAFLATALAMQAAVSGPRAFAPVPPSTSEAATVEKIDVPASVAATSLVTNPDSVNNVIVRSSERKSIGFGAVEQAGIGLEPTIELDQLSRYLNHLHELRRINDGDDSADSPGYAMHLVRMPISVLPGEETREGYSAEVTVIAKPNLHDDLLPSTFRQLVINDLVDQLSFLMASWLDSPNAAKVLETLAKIDAEGDEDVEEQVPQKEALLLRPEDPRRMMYAEDLQDHVEDFEIVLPGVALTPSRRAKHAFPLSHVPDIYGAYELARVLELLYPLKADTLHAKQTLLLDLQKTLAEHFNAAYDFLELPQNRGYWEHCSQQLHDAVRADSDTVVDLNQNFYDALPDDIYEHNAAFTWMIVVESALLEERLKQDIHDLALAKNAYHLNVDSLDWLHFCGPDPTPDARQLFNDYVACRWPIHVVAVDPITQDQNIADQFSQRREMQMALAVALASGQIGANTFTRMVRRQELDMDTIALHRTVVGFSHGDDTFGWRFYPRFQSPDTGGHFQTFAIDMFKGMNRDTLIEASRLEPGIREVTAIVIMPSFVPYVVFDIRSNWFELTDPTEKVLTLEQTMELSAEITSMRQLSLACTQDAHLYRNDDIYRLQRSVEQLERRLPLQTSIVQMPFESSLGGFEFFNTGVPDLAPELHGFYGEPGIRVKAAATTSATSGTAAATAAATTATATASTPVNININTAPGTAATAAQSSGPSQVGTGAIPQKTSIFLVGNHFSVHETEVIVGNVRLLPIEKKLLSRQVMQIDVPEMVQPIISGGAKYVDIHVATPYGISNHLLVPVAEEEKKPEAKSEGATAISSPYAFSWKTDKLKGCLVYECAGSQRPELHCLEDVVLNMKEVCPCECRPTSIEFAAFVVLKNAKGEEVFKVQRRVTGCISVPVSQCVPGGEVPIVLNASSDPDRAFEEAVEVALSGVCKGSEPLTIELQGCVRFGECDDATCAPTYVRLPVLTITATECADGTDDCRSCPPGEPRPCTKSETGTASPRSCQPVQTSQLPEEAILLAPPANVN